MAQDADARTQGEPAPAGSDPVLVAFDFDGTLTVRDSFTAFLRWRAGPLAFAVGLARLAPAALAYLFHKDRGRIKAASVRVYLRGLSQARLEADAAAFAAEVFAAMLRPDALQTFRTWREAGARVLIVSASPTFVVAPFAERLGADELIATELAYDPAGRVAGGFATPNCRGPEKVARLQQRFGPEVRLEAAYGDTAGDHEMLQIAKIQGYRVFNVRP